jgi:hypothetical protein
MQFRVVIPDECEEGETLRIHIADGTEANVTIPSGLVRGDSFVFEVPTEQMKNPQALLKEQQQEYQQEQEQQQQSKQNNNNNNKLSKRQQRKQKNQQQNVHPIVEIETRPHSEFSLKLTTASLVVDIDAAHNSSIDYNNATTDHPHNTLLPSPSPPAPAPALTTIPPSTTQPPKGFLEKEIIDCQDFMLALAIGLLVGAAIVFGFLLGILHSTEAIYAVHPIEKPKQRSQTNLYLQQQKQPQQQRRQPTKIYHPSENSPLAAPIETIETTSS